VILAHPERYIYNQKDIDDLRRIHESGVLLQVTAAAVSEQNSRTLFDLQMVDVVASDAHSDTYRVTAMDMAFEWVTNAYGGGLANRLFVDTPQRLLDHR
jgi:tyrosine-protein phosphatase YwqE